MTWNWKKCYESQTESSKPCALMDDELAEVTKLVKFYEYTLI